MRLEAARLSAGERPRCDGMAKVNIVENMSHIAIDDHAELVATPEAFLPRVSYCVLFQRKIGLGVEGVGQRDVHRAFSREGDVDTAFSDIDIRDRLSDPFLKTPGVRVARDRNANIAVGTPTRAPFHERFNAGVALAAELEILAVQRLYFGHAMPPCCVRQRRQAAA